MPSLIAELYYNEPVNPDLAIVIPYEKSTTRSHMNYLYMLEKMKVAKIPVFTEIPETYTKIAFIDPDIIFAEPDWYNMLSELLNTHDVVQCFDTIRCLDITYRNCVTQKTSNEAYAWAINKADINKKTYLPVLIYSMFRDTEPSVNVYNKIVTLK
jgi:hypothetical protein